jgi:glyoxylase-like metal-dependent hydrolase (beta-lactamase superfamily II)
MDPPELMVPESHPGEEPSPSRSALSAAPPGPIRSDELDPRASLEPGRPLTAVLPGLWLFPPNQDSQGGSAWLLETPDLDLLIDCPALSQANLAFLDSRGRRAGAAGAGRIVLTGRDGHGRCRRLQEQLGWPVVVQEQEAYLLPGVDPLLTFASEWELAPGVRLLWTPGPSPGACVLHAQGPGPAGDGLFCGRLLVPLGPGSLAPLRRRNTFHWPRQVASVERLVRWLPAGSPGWIASGAGLGALRGGRIVTGAAALLASLRPDPGAPSDPLAGG